MLLLDIVKYIDDQNSFMENDYCPLVSVIMPIYNRENTVERAIKSVLEQTYSNLEVILVDDGSKDNTLDILSKIKDDRVKLLCHGSNKGGSAARNTGLKIATGDYIAFLDSDDEWLPQKLEMQINVLSQLDGEVWGGIYCGHYSIEANRTVMVKALKRGDLRLDIFRNTTDFGFGSTTMFTKGAIAKIGLFDESFVRHQDYEYLIRFFRQFKICSIEEPLVNTYGHNLPSAEKLATIKEQYLSKFSEDIYQFDDATIGEILAIQWLEVAQLYANEGRFRLSQKYIFKSSSYKILPLHKYIPVCLNLLKSLRVRIQK